MLSITCQLNIMGYKLSFNITFIHILILQYTSEEAHHLPIIDTSISNIHFKLADKKSFININKSRGFLMSTSKNDTSDIKQAAENADVEQIENNLKENKQVNMPKELTKEQATPFIDEEVRTDK